jgi:solute carrier family 8 (sodium/calcium exchanger)
MFLGVAIVADIFMAAIEKVTSQKKRVFDKAKGEWYTTKVWNGTVANLTLMALGSSAPEILLNVIELLGNDFYAGALGPSTIVGSAAFNLFVIIAVCIMSIPNGEQRTINDLQVFGVTGVSSVFAYIWLLMIVQGGWSKDVIEPWEGVLTFLWFPLLVVVAFVADKGYFTKGGAQAKTQMKKFNLETARTKDLAKMEKEMRALYGDDLSEEEMAKLIDSNYGNPVSRAAYRIGAIRGMVGGKRVHLRSEQVKNEKQVKPEPQKQKDDKTFIEFLSGSYTVGEADKTIELGVRRRGCLARGTVRVNYRTVEGSATAGTDFETTEGELVFPSSSDGEVETKTISIPIINDRETEKDEWFYVELFDAKSDDNKVTCVLGKDLKAKVTIVDDDLPGEIKFKNNTVEVKENPQDWIQDLKVLRVNGSSGAVSCKFHTEQDTAITSVDFEETSGVVEFAEGQQEATIHIKIISNNRPDDSDLFRVILEEPTGGAKFPTNTDGGEKQEICSIQIFADQVAKDRLAKVQSQVMRQLNKSQVGHANWKSQFIDAVMVNGGGEDGERDPPRALDWIMHIITIFWKVLFAFIPPTDYCGGWLSFCCALIMIGGVTAYIGDLASLVGCVYGIPDSITAVTLVALGTSLPDTFASKTAAVQDEFADNSIGNVTGSNSVNVFLGIGLPWMVGAIFWSTQGQSSNEERYLEWVAKYVDVEGSTVVQDNPLGDVFVVMSGSLGYSVAIFCVLAVTCLGLVVARRMIPQIGCELGGPPGAKYGSAIVMVSMWLLFLILYILKVMDGLTDCD